MRAKLTKTQRIILVAAASSPGGSVRFGPGDRRGTRVAGFDRIGRPVIIAYCTPEWFLEGRKLLEKANEPYVFRITDLGRAAIAAVPMEGKSNGG